MTNTDEPDAFEELSVRKFVVANLQDGVRRVTETRFLFVDVDGNRFEIEDVRRLDRRSIALLKKVL